MDDRQKKELQILLKSRKRGNKILARQRELRREQTEHHLHLEKNLALMEQYTQKLTTIAGECGLLQMVEKAAQYCNGTLLQKVSYYVDYGLAASSLALTDDVTEAGELKASYLALRITWGEPESMKEVEIHVHLNGMVTFHNSWLPVFRFVWRHSPSILKNRLANALQHPRPPSLSW